MESIISLGLKGLLGEYHESTRPNLNSNIFQCRMVLFKPFKFLCHGRQRYLMLAGEL